uniref:Partial AB-hydrolase lipase domain-containing protein n=1 Tax=Strigamia maritima TaxID=126957 RepID=T1J8T3_STRMM
MSQVLNQKIMNFLHLLTLALINGPCKSDNTLGNSQNEQSKQLSISERIKAKIKIWKIVTSGMDYQFRSLGYSFESHEITTQDGYILTLFRLAGKPGASHNTPVLILSGIGSTPQVFALHNMSLGIAYFLMNNGYDVWLGNFRGNLKYSHHVKYSQSDSEFWNFSWEEMADYDLPSIIDYVLQKNTNHTQLHLVTLSLSTILGMALQSSKPEYNEKVLRHVAMAPVAFAKYTTASPFIAVRHYYNSIKRNYENSLQKHVPTYLVAKLLFYGGTIVCLTFGHKLCVFLIDMTFGYTPENLEDVAVMDWSFITSGVSFKTFVHLFDLLKYNDLMRYDYGEEENQRRYGTVRPPVYDLGRITSPTSLFYGANDPLATPLNVEMVSRRIKTSRKELMERIIFNHADFAALVDLNSLISVNKKILEHLQLKPVRYCDISQRDNFLKQISRYIVAPLQWQYIRSAFSKIDQLVSDYNSNNQSKMKSLALLLCLIILNGNGKNCSGFSFITILNHKIQVYKTAVADTEQQIQHYGYPMETYHVTTPDGYILTVQRILHKPNTTGYKPALLLPGMSTTSSVFVQFSNSLAFYLANKGYDVWLGNLRGSLQYSHHVKYSQLDSKFWNFSWEEMGDHDVPSTVDYILHKTNHTQLPIISWSMSSIVTAAMLAAKPVYNNKVTHHIALAPVIYRYYTFNLLSSVLLFFYDILKGLYDLAVDKGIWNYIIFKAGLPIAPIACLTIGRSTCETIMAVIAGYTPAAQEASITVAHSMGGFSFKTGLHMLQSELIRINKYSVEKHEVKTTDGYILTLLRIPTGLKNLSRNGIPVLILPGLSCKPNIYVTSSDSIAYFLADHWF